MNLFKTSFLPLLLLAGPFSFGSTQQDSTRAFGPKLSAGIHLGLAFSDLSDDHFALPLTQTNLNVLDRKQAVNGRIGVAILLHLKGNLTLETGIAYEKIGAKAAGAYDPQTNTVNLEDDAVTKIQYEYFSVPVLFKMLFNDSGAIQYSFHTGPYFGYLQSAVFSYKTTVLIQNPDGSFFEQVREQAIQIESHSRSRDIGLRFRLGVEKRISQQGTLFGYAFYSQGLTRVDDFAADNASEISDGRHRVFGLGIGGYFLML